MMKGNWSDRLSAIAMPGMDGCVDFGEINAGRLLDDPAKEKPPRV
jgi:hypothetical protein